MFYAVLLHVMWFFKLFYHLPFIIPISTNFVDFDAVYAKAMAQKGM